MSVLVHSTSERQAGQVQHWAGSQDSHGSATAWAGVMGCNLGSSRPLCGSLQGSALNFSGREGQAATP